ncbi:Carbamoyl-phosphate synthase L chain ATP- binding [Catenulispora acidiphila DSM 44928]|uniref:biotin carboxylase n=1 Tax=Catenulispora acidiphila (strain DSM 44928 / JCM 14897 / NBRC 102108 / NRRL B-24433 / ID139908) TaxID=479433 RepID=C7QHI0_CATAD|nr:biotin carboxylase N-terminal domain-containing protein [Catenulispora acidiphila]ACU69119.1 Carbamoyl-phosphate synthase L chain ATP- binding [Catenulispora acidiphila DSM 44928]
MPTYPTFSTVLVANRGEIARRVFRTAKAMGLRTVAVYSDPDADAPHVREADVAVALGGSTSAESYLDAAKILDAARKTGADAVHPGYGFLSENAGFAEACAQAGIVFVGPSPDAIRKMGIKHEAKAIAKAAGVPVLPDALLTTDEPDDWRRSSEGVGFPLLVKASAGGGGKGMRLVSSVEELENAVSGARREAAAAFGDGTVFLERYLAASRHIEIQVFGDTHGNAVFYGERECSVQRRHQKVVEEAPSSAVGAAVRAKMGEVACALVRELGYVGAGTVEFLFDDTDDSYYFLEMNTRLQVEHPVTEEVWGQDLVRRQFEVAAGAVLTAPDPEALHGHAIEVRLYAEDPARKYIPSPGTLALYEHADVPGIRYEDGVRSGSVVSHYYDPMLSKVVATGLTRGEAALKLASALAGMRIQGLKTNRDQLVAILRDPDFLAGTTRTDFLDLHPALAAPEDRTDVTAHLAAALAVSVHRRRSAGGATAFAPAGWRLLPYDGANAAWTRQDVRRAPETPITYRFDSSTLYLIHGGAEYEVSLRDLGPDSVRVAVDGVDRLCRVRVAEDTVVWVDDSDGGHSAWKPTPRFPEDADAFAADDGAAEVPGTVVAISVAAGDRVKAGQVLVSMEAMKMEHQVKAGRDGVVGSVDCAVGQFVDAHQVLVTLT